MILNWRILNFLKPLFSSQPAENHNQPVCEDHEPMAMLGKDLQKKKFTTRINPPDHPPEESSRSSTRGYKSRGGPWATGETGKTVNYGSHSTPADSLLFTAKGNVPSNFTLPKIPKNSNAGSKKLFSNAVGSINQNQNAKSSNARTRHSHPQQGPSVSSEQQRSVNIRGRGKGKEKVNDATIDLTNDEDPIEQFSDQGDPPANLHITSRPLQSSSMTEDPLRLPIRSRHNAQVEIKGSQDFQAKSNHNVERQHLTSQGKVITNSFVPQRMYLSAEEGLATLPFPGACACSRLYLEGRDIIFVGQLPLKFEMRFRPQDIDNVVPRDLPLRVDQAASRMVYPEPGSQENN
ncbi:uncharacterized protein MELLADRAFT_88636 [Melampsora larici-populina 98AG31]|uniref:Uncharacterized protein n=1 Tax=Melampsora larici-populina (strain 98AG31 / pathotype 3-4-7) TaxID=747676 RepID=F4RSF5_MELLP|nr:uncharacterized protein MELLADRAFT_88636 [Melampsora larici-populina 98AG31]EGG04590.1 hypothetical protein MELLADRAFT_88636 [Melampsora larici-populina 98AG31]